MKKRDVRIITCSTTERLFHMQKIRFSTFQQIAFSILVSLAFVTSTESAMIFTETFPSGPVKSGWSGGGIGSSGGQIEQNDRLEFFANDYSRSFLLANASASNGAFVGDFPVANIDSIEFDLQLFAGSVVTSLSLEVARFSVPNHRWQFSLTPPVAGITTRYSVPITPDGSGWTRTSGSDSFATTISNVFEVVIVLENSLGPLGDVSGFIDNVATVPEPSSMLLLTSGLLFFISSRRVFQKHCRTRRWTQRLPAVTPAACAPVAPSGSRESP